MKFISYLAEYILDVNDRTLIPAPRGSASLRGVTLEPNRCHSERALAVTPESQAHRKIRKRERTENHKINIQCGHNGDSAVAARAWMEIRD